MSAHYQVEYTKAAAKTLEKMQPHLPAPIRKKPETRFEKAHDGRKNHSEDDSDVENQKNLGTERRRGSR